MLRRRRNWTETLTYLLTHGAESFLRSHELGRHSRTSQHFMEPKVQYHIHKSPALLPIANHINPIHTIPILSLRFILILSTYVFVFPVVYFLLALPQIFYKHSSSPPTIELSSYLKRGLLLSKFSVPIKGYIYLF
jgi:hypothetical protein